MLRRAALTLSSSPSSRASIIAPHSASSAASSILRSAHPSIPSISSSTSSRLFSTLHSNRIASSSSSSSISTFSTFQSRAFSASTAAASSSSADNDGSHSDFAPQQKQRVSNGVEDAKAQIAKDISTHDVFLYMKGSPAQPRCGFSASVVKILNSYPGVKFGSRDVLEDEYVREGIKQFSDWPTLPQLFVHGEFVGGSDIVGNMYKTGELDTLLGKKPAKKQ